MYLIFSVETTDVAARVVTDRHTNTRRQTHPQDKYRNPTAHAHQGLMKARIKWNIWQGLQSNFVPHRPHHPAAVENGDCLVAVDF